MKKSTLLIAVLTPLLVLANLAFTPPGDGGGIEDCQDGGWIQFQDGGDHWGFTVWVYDCLPDVYIEDLTCARGHAVHEWSWDECTNTLSQWFDFFGSEEPCGYYGGPA